MEAFQWPQVINVVQKVAEDGLIPKGVQGFATEGKTPPGWEVLRALTEEERRDLVEGPHDPHHYMPPFFI